jgi:chromosome partitioning protein
VASTRLAGIVVFLVKHAGRAASGYTNIHTEQIAALRRTWKGDVIKTIGKNKISVPEAVNAGYPVWNYRATNVTQAVEDMMTSICEELKARIDL